MKHLLLWKYATHCGLPNHGTEISSLEEVNESCLLADPPRPFLEHLYFQFFQKSLLLTIICFVCP